MAAPTPQRLYRVVRVSTATGRVLKVLATGLDRDSADAFARGAEPGPRTAVRVQPEGQA